MKSYVSEHSEAGYHLSKRQFIRLLPYQILLLIVNSLNGIIDGIFASNIIGLTAMSAIGLFNPLNHFLYAISIMLVSGSQILYGKYLGKNQRQELNNVFNVDLGLSGIISVLIAAMIILLVRFNVTSFMIGEAEELEAFNEYLLGQSLGIPALVLGQQLFAFLSLENQTRLTMFSCICCIASNTLMNYLFLVVMKLGTFGLALGSSFSYWIFFAVMAAYYIRGKSEIKISLRGLKWHESKNIMRLGYSGSLSRCAEMFRCFIVNFLILEYVGSVGLSSFAASNSVMAIFWTIPFGMMAVTRMLLSISVGDEDRVSTTDIMRVSVRYGLLIISFVVVFIIVLAEPLTRLFFQDSSEPVYDMTVMGLRLLPLCMPLSVIALTFACYAQIMEKKLLSIILPLFDGMLGVVICSMLLIPFMKMNGLYVANILNGVICVIIIIIFAVKDRKRFPLRMEDLIALPDKFGGHEDEYLDITVKKLSEVSDIACRIEEFCISRGIDKHRSALSGLAMEEMAGNVVTHGFGSDPNSGYSADIKVMCRNGEVTLRLRDNCRPFNPSDAMKISESGQDFLNSAKDVQYHIGIRLAFGISKYVQYKNILGLNVLIVKI